MTTSYIIHVETKPDTNVLALVKDAERYVFIYDDDHVSETLKTLGKFAINPELSFSWYEAAVLSQKIRQQVRETVLQDMLDKCVTAAPQERGRLMSEFFGELSRDLISSEFHLSVQEVS